MLLYQKLRSIYRPNLTLITITKAGYTSMNKDRCDCA